MPEPFTDAVLIVARVLMGSLFIIGGLRHFPLLDAITPALAARNVPFPRAVLILGSAFEVGFGVLLVLGLFIPIACIALIVFTITASVMLVNFWDKAEPERGALLGVFLSNLAIIGGLLAIAAGG